MRYILLVLCLTVAARGAEVVVAFPKLRFDKPLYLTHAADGTDRLYVVEQDGVVKVIQDEQAHVILDIRSKVLRQGNEEGLLGLAFHPKFAQNRELFLCYSAGKPRRNVLSRWKFAREEIDPGSEKIVLEVAQPWSNHNGGGIEFGPDGMLYYTLGDGGSGGDPQNNGQRLDTLLGKILRLDVDRTEGGLAYAIPRDNPFVGRDGVRQEIWAYGLRNVWRFSFDRETGLMWGGDVGQNQWEEIHVIEKGGNHGWRIREGRHAHNPDPKNTGPFVEPIVDHPRSEAWSITGGYVYRGEKIPELQGWYVYGDFGSGLIWALRYDPKKKELLEHKATGKVHAIASFGVDRHNELYICSFDGRIYKLVP